MEEKLESIFKTLNAVDCSAYVEKKNGLTYLSWIWAWTEVKKRYPDATWGVMQFSDGTPYLRDPELGYLVQTWVNIEGHVQTMQLPVMDGANKAQKNIKYTYQVAEYANNRRTGKMIDKAVEAATMFDINTAYMRCMTKNLALFGLGAYIYAGEDLPEVIENEKPTDEPKADTKTAETPKSAPAAAKKTATATKAAPAKAVETPKAVENPKPEPKPVETPAPVEGGSAIKPSASFEEPAADDARKVNALAAFKKLSEPKVLMYLIKAGFKYTDVASFIEGETIEVIEKTYSAVTVKK